MTIQEQLKQNQNSIVARINAGESTSKIAKDYKCNPGSIWLFLQSIGVKTKKRSSNYGKVDNRKDEIINLYKNGAGSYIISKKLGISKPVIIRKLKEWGLDLSQNNKVDKDNLLKDKKEQVIELFNEGNSCESIGQKLGHAGSSVMQLLNKEGYNTSDWKYKVDETFFEKIDTQEKAYILGWMYSDGNVMPDGKFRICLNIKDEEIIHKIRAILQYDGPLYFKDARNTSEKQVELCINRKKMTHDLNKLGVVPAKSLIITFPTEDQVPHNLIHHFVRGVFDGDGSLSTGVTICGSYNFVTGLAKVSPCKVTNIYQRYKNRPQEKSAHQLFIGRIEETKKFFAWLYQDATIYLERKRKIVEEYLNKGV